jgi:hypothetical protein
MHRIPGAVLAAVLAVGVSQVGAQSSQVETKTTKRIEIDGGREVTLTGCVGQSSDGSAFMLTNVGNTLGELKSYHLIVADGDDDEAKKLARYVGQKVEIRGKASDEGEATVKTSMKTEIERPGPDHETETKGEMKGNIDGIAFLGVDSVRQIAKDCP